MNRKTIFKMLAAAMLMPTMLLTTACSNSDDEIINTENPANTKGYALPVTINVTRQGDDATTRATYTYDEDTKKGTLAFSTGDKLFVSGSYGDDYSFAGILDYVSDGTFSGTIMTQTEWKGTTEELLSAEYGTDATLLPAGYGEYGYLSIADEGTYEASLSENINKAFATSKATAVEQFSDEYADSYSNGFVLTPSNAIVSFTISGLAANTPVAVLFKDNYDTSATPVNVTTDATGVATFASAMHNYNNFNDYSLTVDGNAITLPADKEVEAGHIYNISRSVAPAGPTAYTLTESTVGMIVGSDGNAYAVEDKDNLPSGVTAVAMVAYKSATAGESLAIQLNDSPEYKNWADTKTYVEGLSAVPGGTWRLPSKADWQNMFVGCAVEGDASSPDADNKMNPIAGFKAKIVATGIGWQSSTYWSSTESPQGAWIVYVRLAGKNADASFYDSDYASYDDEYVVLGCLAF